MNHGQVPEAPLNREWQDILAYVEDQEKFKQDDLERQRKLEFIKGKLQSYAVESSIKKEKFVLGLLKALGYFSMAQLNVLERFLEKCENLDEEIFAFSSERLDKASLLLFNQFLYTFYEMVSRVVLGNYDEEKVKALITVAWHSIQECASHVQKALSQKKPLTSVQLIIIPFQKQLQALDPEHPFNPAP